MPSPPISYKIYTDQTGRDTAFPTNPQRIISLVPSQTELLAYLGLEKETVGITKFCTAPQTWYRNKTRIGGTKNVDFTKIAALNPDLIIANKEENQKEQIEALAEKYPLWMSDIVTLEAALEMITEVGEITGRAEKAQLLAAQIQSQFAVLQGDRRRLRTAYFIWQKPYMVAAGGTFINEMMKIGGFDNVFSDLTRYPEVTEALLQERNPEVILLSSEPFPFGEKHMRKFADICPKAVVCLADGTLFSWYGSRLLQTPDYLSNLHLDLSKKKDIY